MKNLRNVFLVIAALALAACSKSAPNTDHVHLPVHIDPTAPGAVYQRLFGMNPVKAGELDAIVKMGERNLEWLTHINSHISSEEKLSFSSKATMGGYPMDKPNRYSNKRVLARFEEAKAQMPLEMREVLIDGKPFTNTPPIKVEEYLAWGLKLDKIYQTATRWLLVTPFQWQYKMLRAKDIRGYYFLSVEPNLDAKLTGWSKLDKETQDRLTQWLVLECLNTEGSMSTCEQYLNSMITKDQVLQFHQRYVARAKSVFNKFFAIGATRSDIVWNSSKPNLINFPFRDPNNEAIADFLKVNIEDEWKWGAWKLVLNFLPNALTHMVFEAGTTPHVNGLAGNTITMDANAPLTEYDVQWTIRHEFGHVLGFPDCYIEFFEEETGDMVNYQIDTSNLMCSRAN
jgi:hypothetical protein